MKQKREILQQNQNMQLDLMGQGRGRQGALCSRDNPVRSSINKEGGPTILRESGYKTGRWQSRKDRIRADYHHARI